MEHTKDEKRPKEKRKKKERIKKIKEILKYNDSVLSIMFYHCFSMIDISVYQ